MASLAISLQISPLPSSSVSSLLQRLSLSLSLPNALSSSDSSALSNRDGGGTHKQIAIRSGSSRRSRRTTRRTRRLRVGIAVRDPRVRLKLVGSGDGFTQRHSRRVLRHDTYGEMEHGGLVAKVLGLHFRGP